MVHNPLIGAWNLVGYTCKAGDRELDSPLGPDPVGYILYTADGHMSVQIAAAERPHFAAEDLLGGTSAEKEAAAAGKGPRWRGHALPWTGNGS